MVQIYHTKKLYELFPALKAYFVSESEHIDLTKYILVIQQQKVISWHFGIFLFYLWNYRSDLNNSFSALNIRAVDDILKLRI